MAAAAQAADRPWFKDLFRRRSSKEHEEDLQQKHHFQQQWSSSGSPRRANQRCFSEPCHTMLDLVIDAKTTKKAKATKRWSSGDDNNNNINHNERDELAKSDTDLDFRLGESLFPEILSIPLSIHPNNSNHQGEGQQNGEGQGGDAAEDCQSTNSLMSEVTFMTYSDEKAEMIRDEFFRQVKLQTKALSVQERESLLVRVEREQKIKFDKKLERTRKKHQRHMEKQEKKKQQKHQPSWSSPNKNNKKGNNTQKISEDYDLLKKLRAFKMGETTDEIDGGEPQQQLTLSSRTNNNKRDSKGSPSASATKKKSAIKRTASAESCSSYATAKLSNKISSTRSNTMNDNNDISHLLQQPAENLQNLQNLYTPAKNSSQIARERGDKEEIGGLEQTTVQHQHQEQVSSHQATAITAPASNRTSLRTESSSIKASITDIIELKLLVANQQSLIDTLSSKIHNLEVANRQLHLLQDSTNNAKEEAANNRNSNDDISPPSSRKVTALQAENANLEQQLNECRQREIGLRNELFSQRRRSREKDHYEDSNNDSLLPPHAGEEQVFVRNDMLRRENSDLKRQLEELKRCISNGHDGMSPALFV